MRGSTIMGLLPGDRFRLRDLLYGLMLPSGNDAALAIGRFLAGSDFAFVEQMNALLRRLGLTDSHFANPHGLAVVTTPFITTCDALALRDDPARFREVVNTSPHRLAPECCPSPTSPSRLLWRCRRHQDRPPACRVHLAARHCNGHCLAWSRSTVSATRTHACFELGLHELHLAVNERAQTAPSAEAGITDRRAV
jgi:hypothetical protein